MFWESFQKYLPPLKTAGTSFFDAGNGGS